MGGFLLVSKPRGVGVEETEKHYSDSIGVFKKKGLPLNERLVTPDYVLYVYHKNKLRVENVFKFENDQFIASTGTCLYNGKIGREGLVDLFHDFDVNGEFLERVLGHYCIIIYKNGTLNILNDYTGIYHVFTDSAKKVISSSLLGVAKSLGHRKVSTQELYEYILTEAYHGDRTLIKDISMMDCRAFWQITPEVKATEKPMTFSGLENKSSFNDMVREISDVMTDYYNVIKGNFGNTVCTALSAGFDSRCMLAYLRKVGVDPYVYVYGSDKSSDVTIARHIAQKEGFAIDVENPESFPVYEQDQYRELLEKQFYMYDGLGYEWGVFGSGFDMSTRSKRAERSRLQLQGGGGEILRNRWLFIDKELDALSVLKSRWDTVAPQLVTGHFNKQDFFRNLLEKSRQIVDSPNGKLDRRQVEILHPFFALNSWLGNNNRINNQYTYAMTPYMNLKIVIQSFDIPIRYKNMGALHAALIKEADPGLARYPSQYGYNFYDYHNVPLKQKAIYNAKLHLPIPIRNLIKRYFWKKRQFSKDKFPYYLKQPYLNHIFKSDDLLVSEYVHIDAIQNYQMLSRALSAELLLRDLF